MTPRLPVDRRPSTWLDFSALAPRPLPVRDDPVYDDVPRLSRLERIRILASSRHDRVAELNVAGHIEADRAPLTESELRAMWGDR